MINAGVSISPFNGLQMWDSENQRWNGIEVKVTYPDDQNIDDNPISVDDYLIEAAGFAWKVVDVTLKNASNNVFELTLDLTNGEASEDTPPSLGSSRSGIITPVNGFMAPYWDVSIVNGNVGRIANYLTMKNAAYFWSGDVPGTRLEDSSSE